MLLSLNLLLFTVLFEIVPTLLFTVLFVKEPTQFHCSKHYEDKDILLCNICVFQHDRGESSESVQLNSSHSDRWILGWTDPDGERGEIMEEESVSDSVRHSPASHVSLTRPTLYARGGAQKKTSWLPLGRRQNSTFIPLIPRKHAPALLPWRLKGGTWKRKCFWCFFVFFVI